MSQLSNPPPVDINNPVQKFQRDLGMALADSVNKNELIEIFRKRLIKAAA